MAAPAVAIAHAIGVVARQPTRVPRLFQIGAYPLGGRYVLFRRVGFISAFVLTGVLLMIFLFTPVHLSPFIYFQF
ncbi:MAG TPA: hypothetical protein VK636_01225 [Gemmatimonadaceae bacterium]|nr:hypothetical protein [Gemmatimonadaceae bacterium]